MLSRATLPLMRCRAIPFPVKTYLPALPTRRYTKNNKPHSPSGYKIPASARSSNQQFNPNQRSRVVRDPNAASRTPQHFQQSSSNDQPKIDSISEWQKPTGPGTGMNPTQTGKSGSQSESSNPQSESETSGSDHKDRTEPEPEPEPPAQPLPDLTQGIPPTLAGELEARSKRRGPAALNLTEDPARAPAGDGDGGGDIPKNAYISSLERRRNRIANLAFAIFLGLAVSGTIYLGRNWATESEEKEHPDAPSGWGFGLFFSRIKARTFDITSYYKDPAFQKLLPDEDPQLRQPYTLVLSLEDLLVHSEWSREHGWRVAKRPGVDYFLRYLNQYYELVLFTSVPSMMADQVLRKLDPYRIIRWPLFREATRYEDGEYVKVWLAFIPVILWIAF